MTDLPAILAIATAIAGILGAPALIIWRYFSNELKRVQEARIAESKEHAEQLAKLTATQHVLLDVYQKDNKAMTKIADDAITALSMGDK